MIPFSVIKYAAIALLSITALVLLILFVRTKRPFGWLFLNALIGIAATLAVNLTSRFTGVHIPINEWTLCGIVSLGLPAVCGLVILPLIF